MNSQNKNHERKQVKLHEAVIGLLFFAYMLIALFVTAIHSRLVGSIFLAPFLFWSCIWCTKSECLRSCRVYHIGFTK